VRLAKEIKPVFIFLENVPAIRTRGLETVVGELSGAGYDCRWGMLSAYDMGAPHKRERWFLLAYSKSNGDRRNAGGIFGKNGQVERPQDEYEKENLELGSSRKCCVLDTLCRRYEPPEKEICTGRDSSFDASGGVPESAICRVDDELSDGLDDCRPRDFSANWWDKEWEVPRVEVGVKNRVDRIKCLGNAVVPMQAREAFMRLSGMKLEAVK